MEIALRSLLALFLIAVLYVTVRALGQYMKGMFAILDAAESTEAGFIIFDERGGLEYVNPVAREAIPLLRAPQETPSLSAFLAYIQDNSQAVDQSLQEALIQSDKDAQNFSFREFLSFEPNRIFLIKMSKIKGRRVLFVVSDVSKSKYREESFLKLHEHNHQLLQAIEASTCGIIVSDPNQSQNPVIFVNDALCEFLNLPQAAIIAGSWDIILNALDTQSARETLLLATLNGTAEEIETQITHNDVVRSFAVKFNPVEDDIGTLDLYVCVFTDITLLKQRENEIIQSQKLEALGQLAAGIAHDFNNVLSIVDGYSVMAEKSIPDEPEKAKSYLQKISASAKRGAGLTQKMLTFSRHKVISKNVINLTDVLAENRAFLMPLLDAGIRFEMRPPPEPIAVKTTADAMGQVLMNLCINARDAMPKGGLLIIEARRIDAATLPEKILTKLDAPDIVRLGVTDTGTGMDAKTRERIFDPFFTTKAQGKGTGLGLSVVYGLVKEMGGVIDVVSELGRGTEIAIYLPISTEQPTKMVMADSNDPSKIRLEGYTALVVEDEPDLLHAVCAILEGFGLKTIPASCGNEALVRQDEIEGDIDLMLTDVMMPGINGVKLAELMASLRPDMKVMFMSGYPASGDMAPIEIPKDAVFAAKPVNYDKLACLLRDMLEQEKLTKIKVDDKNLMQLWVHS